MKAKDILKDICNRLEILEKSITDFTLDDNFPAQYRQSLEAFTAEIQDIRIEATFRVLSVFDKFGTKKTFAKKVASIANGKKGGRPPKRIAETKNNIRELEEELKQIEVSLFDCEDNQKDLLIESKTEKTKMLHNLESELLIMIDEWRKSIKTKT